MSVEMGNKDKYDYPTFERCVKDHTMEIVYDLGVNRLLTFSNHGSSIYKYSLVTWPGYLTVTGDMGSYMFMRTKDMFELFRPCSDEMVINPGYWSEKLVATDVGSGHIEFSVARLKEVIDTYIEELLSGDLGIDADDIPAMKEEMLEVAKCESAEDAYEKAQNCSGLYDFWECSLTEYTTRYKWCLWAIVHGIRMYDNK